MSMPMICRARCRTAPTRSAARRIRGPQSRPSAARTRGHFPGWSPGRSAASVSDQLLCSRFSRPLTASESRCSATMPPCASGEAKSPDALARSFYGFRLCQPLYSYGSLNRGRRPTRVRIPGPRGAPRTAVIPGQPVPQGLGPQARAIGLADEDPRQRMPPGTPRARSRSRSRNRPLHRRHHRGVDVPVGVAEPGHVLAGDVLQDARLPPVSPASAASGALGSDTWRRPCEPISIPASATCRTCSAVHQGLTRARRVPVVVPAQKAGDHEHRRAEAVPPSTGSAYSAKSA